MPPRPDFTITYKNRPNKRKRTMRNKTRKIVMSNSGFARDPIFIPLDEEDLSPALRKALYERRKQREYERSPECIQKKWQAYLEYMASNPSTTN
jgi:hypothetical protein